MSVRRIYNWKKSDLPQETINEIRSSPFYSKIMTYNGVHAELSVPGPSATVGTSAPLSTAGLPSSVDLRSNCSPVEDQSNLGSCTAHGLAGALQYLEKKAGVVPYINLSRLFIYYNERVIEGTTNYDSGAYIHDGIACLVTKGACNETLWPYTISKYRIKPPSTAYTNGLSHRISQYSYIDNTNLTALKTVLANGYPIVFGFVVYASFESDTVTNTGVVPMPSPQSGDYILGGHCCLIVGFSDSTSRFLCRNSWGSSWALSGYFTIPYAYLTDSTLASDFWVIDR